MRWILLLLTIWLTGCMTADKTVNVTNDRFSNRVTITGREVVVKNQAALSVERQKYFLRTWIDKQTQAVSHQLYYHIDYNGADWRTFYKASLEGGKNLEVTRISTDVTVDEYDTRYFETIGATVPHKYLVNNKDGFPVKWYAQDGTTKVTYLKPKQIKKQLKALQEQRSKLTSNN